MVIADGTLAVIWAAIIGTAVAMYVVLDGSISASAFCFRRRGRRAFATT